MQEQLRTLHARGWRQGPDGWMNAIQADECPVVLSLEEVLRAEGLTSDRDPREDPQPGDQVQHQDGGIMYVTSRGHGRIEIARRPDSIARERFWITLDVFRKEARNV